LTTAVFPLSTFTTRFYTTPEGNALPFELLNVGAMPALLVAATLSALITLWFGKRTGIRVVIVLLWIALTAVVHNPSWLGLPLLWILENFSALIALFVPLSILIALGVSTVVQWVEAHGGARAFLVEPIATVAVLAVAFWSAPTMLNVVNPVTVLAEADDLTALNWIPANTPDNAVFLVNERLWLNPIYAGTDAGYWIPNLTGRRTTMPIVFYLMGPVSYWREDVNALAARIEASPDPDDASFLAELRTRGVTHVYIGAKGGPLPLDKFLQSSHYQQVYTVGNAHVFAIHP
ncbi:MAG: hypothetical protein LC737_03305, partial [Chloroflexi bacterium]|nr:hypothetical protein [Chloroflexota bacterium]